MALPPPPIQAQSGEFIWVDWYNQLSAYLTNGNSIPWSVINKAGSLLSDIATRTHVMLQSVQGGNATEQYHLTAAEHAALPTTYTGTGATVLQTSPTLITPALGTPSSGIATNLTGTASGLTAGNIIANGWTTYTPVLSASSGSYTTSSVTGAYLVIGSLVFLRIKATITTIGTGGVPIVTLPFTANSGANSDYVILTGKEIALTGNALQAQIAAGATTTGNIVTYNNGNPAASGAICILSGCYIK
jgi:hypothetical protein